MKESKMEIQKPICNWHEATEDGIKKAFLQVEKKEELVKDKEGVIFLTDENTAIEFELQSRKAYGKSISSIELSESIVIKTKEDIDNLKSYLKSDAGKPYTSRTLSLAFYNDNELRHELQENLADLDLKYTVLNLKNLTNSRLSYLEAMQKELDKALKIDEIRVSIDRTSVEKNLRKFMFEFESPSKPISTGFENLDDALGCGGLRDGRLYAIGAISSLGKTTFALNVADNIASSGEDVIIFSLEMSTKELVSKSLSKIMLKMDHNNVKTAINITDKGEWEKDKESVELLNEAIKKYSDSAKHLHVLEGTGDIGVKEIRDYIDNFQRVGCLPRVVIIDYLQILHPYKDNFSDKQNIDKNITELKRISRDFNLAVIIISSFNRGNYLTEVSFESFKESGSIEYSCDVIIGLQLEIPEQVYDSSESGKKREILKAIKDAKLCYPRKVELIILKNRMYKAWSKINFEYYTKHDYFKEIPTK